MNSTIRLILSCDDSTAAAITTSPSTVCRLLSTFTPARAVRQMDTRLRAVPWWVRIGSHSYHDASHVYALAGYMFEGQCLTAGSAIGRPLPFSIRKATCWRTARRCSTCFDGGRHSRHAADLLLRRCDLLQYGRDHRPLCDKPGNVGPCCRSGSDPPLHRRNQHQPC